MAAVSSTAPAARTVDRWDRAAPTRPRRRAADIHRMTTNPPLRGSAPTARPTGPSGAARAPGAPGAPGASGARNAAPTLREGDEGPAVKSLQEQLARHGHGVADDGRFGPLTRAALQRFQRDQGLVVDGVAGPAVHAALSQAARHDLRATALQALPADTVLRPGTRGEAVRRLQQRLGDHGEKVVVDGVYGEKTAAAVKAFQQRRGLAVDGVAGPQTIGALVSSPTASPTTSSATLRPSTTTPGASRARAASVTGRAPPPALTQAGATRAPTSTKNVIVKDVLGIRDLRAARGSSAGSAPMAIFDNPETIHSLGVVGSTIAPLAGRAGDTVHDFDGKARVYSIVNNQTQNTLVSEARRRVGHEKLHNIHNSVVVHNPTDKPLVLRVEGTVYSKSITRTDGRIPESYARNGAFRGPQGIAASSFMAKRVGENGYVKKALTIPPGGTRVISDVYQAPGGEVFTLLDLKANGRFRVAQVASEKQLNDDDLQKITRGTYATAGSGFRIEDRQSDFAGADDHRLGRPNGVVGGSVFSGQERIDARQRTGRLLMSTRHKQAPDGSDLQTLSKVPGNKGFVGAAATTNDGAYGMTYDLQYRLENAGRAPQRVRIVMTSPKHAYEGAFNPDGGMLTLPVRIAGVQKNLRVHARGTGVVVGEVEVPAGGGRDLRLELTNLGNIYPPVGIEFQPVR
jgi:peptidoglycan hydrolase-like protein with peptidoglycan-binding domain